MYGLCIVPAPPLFWSLTHATVGVPQLSASSVTTNGSTAGMSPIHSTFTAVGLLAVGLVLSSFLNVAGEAPQGLAVPAAMLPHVADVTYCTLILYPVQLSCVCVLLVVHVTPLS